MLAHQASATYQACLPCARIQHLALYHGETGVTLPLDRRLGDAQVALVDGGSLILERGAGPRVDPSLYTT